MGRDSRQARRARDRRQRELQERRGHAPQTSRIGSRWSIIGGIGVIVAAIVIFGGVALTQGNASSSTNAQSTTTAIAETTPVAGMGVGPAQCTYNEMVAAGFYHVHSHLEILVNGKSITIPANIGFATAHDCLYWVHTHSPSDGILHVEAPFKIHPTLGNFFKIWGVPLSRNQVWTYRPGPGETMKVWVNKRPYAGNPAGIVLGSHKLITIEIGPPFKTPSSFTWGSL